MFLKERPELMDTLDAELRKRLELPPLKRFTKAAPALVVV
jgi:hypothetical protein